MRKYISIVFIFLSFSIHAQRGGSAVMTMCPQLGRWLEQCYIKGNSQEASTIMRAIDIFIKTNIANGNWAHVDRVWLFATTYQGNARISLKNPSPLSAWPTDITEVNSIQWVIDSGYKGDATTGYLNSNYTPNTNAVNLTQTSASFGTYSLSSTLPASGSYYEMGTYSSNATGFTTNFGATTSIAKVPDIIGNQLVGLSPNPHGLFWAMRTASNAEASYRNATTLKTGTNAPSILPPYSFFIFQQNNHGGPISGFYSPHVFAFAFVGDGQLNPTTWYNSIYTLLTTIGVN